MTVESVAVRSDLPRLSRRQRQTLDRLMRGDSEKEAALALGISTGTLHCYVKEIYRAFAVNSRGELLVACFEVLNRKQETLPTSDCLADSSQASGPAMPVP
jgi:DNA-binding CsgD family transcriptional regulator